MSFRDILTSDGNGKISSKKLVFLMTWIVASAIVGEMAWRNTLNWDVFTAYLVFGMGSDTFAKMLALRYGAKNDTSPAS